MGDQLPDGEFYACPLCLTAYGRDAFERGVFSDEHVPSQRTGGRVLVLTCTHCNNSAGSAMDADAAAREAVHDFMAGRSLNRALRAEYKIGEVTVQGNVTSKNGAIVMNVVSKANNPKDVTAMTEMLTRWAEVGAGGSIGFRFRERLSPTAASLSWVRAGYLAAFAALG